MRILELFDAVPRSMTMELVGISMSNKCIYGLRMEKDMKCKCVTIEIPIVTVNKLPTRTTPRSWKAFRA
jgi:hypothetical protein